MNMPRVKLEYKGVTERLLIPHIGETQQMPHFSFSQREKISDQNSLREGGRSLAIYRSKSATNSF